jgi:guanyl-specific ribonuclease Sa
LRVCVDARIVGERYDRRLRQEAQMRSKLFMVAAAAVAVGFLLWSQTSKRALEREDAPPRRTTTWPIAAEQDATRDAEREGLETPPPLALPEEERESRTVANANARFPAFLPKEAVATMRSIERGGPYPYRQDDSVFQNRERKLPSQPRGYYREYTVKTPGSRDRGARRIVAGGQPPTEFFYTDDHYRSFRRFTVDANAAGSTP